MILCVGRDKVDNKGTLGDKEISIWEDEKWDSLSLDDTDGQWVNDTDPSAMTGLIEELTPAEFKEKYELDIELILKPGERCAIRADISWELVDQEDA